MTTTATNCVPDPDGSAREVTVAIDVAGPDPAAVALAVGLARHFTAGLLGVLIEDEALLRAAGLPFAMEIVRHSGSERRLDTAALERRSRRAAHELDDLLGAQADIDARVRTARGQPARVLVECFATSDILVVGRAPRSRWRAAPETAPLMIESRVAPQRRLDAVAAALQPTTRTWPWRRLRRDRTTTTTLLAQLRARRPSLVLARLADTGADAELGALFDALDCPLVLLR